MQTIESPTKPAREEINGHILKLMVGIMALCLAALTNAFNKLNGGRPLESISDSYWQGGWSQTIFLGFLFAIAAFLFAYNGKSTAEMIMSKIASLAAIGVAMFPCGCGDHTEIIKRVHFISAGLMFIVLVYFCYKFYKRALEPKDGETVVYTEAIFRAFIYAVCGIAICTVIAGVSLDALFTEEGRKVGPIVARFQNFIFYAEETGLVAFGIAWLVASRTIPLITAEPERFSLNPYLLQVEK